MNISTALLSSGSFDPNLLPITDLAYQLSDPCTLSGCGYGSDQRIYDIAVRENNYHSDYPNDGFAIVPTCEGGCLAPDDLSTSVSPTGRDIRYFRIFNQTESERLSNSLPPIPFELTASSPMFIYFLEFRNEIQWSPLCKQSRQDVEGKNNAVQATLTAQSTLLGFSVVGWCVLSFYLPIIVCCWPKWDKKHKTCQLVTSAFFKLATLICTIVTIALAYSTLGFWQNVNSSSTPCSDPLTSETFQSLGDIYQSLSYKNVGSVTSASFASVADVVQHVLRCLR